MVRSVVMDGMTVGRPIYVAADEEDATEFLRKKAEELKAERPDARVVWINSLRMEVRSPTDARGYGFFRQFEVINAPTWEEDPVPVELVAALPSNNPNLEGQHGG